MVKVHFIGVAPSYYARQASDEDRESWTVDVYGPITTECLNASVQAKLNCEYQEFNFRYNETLSEGEILTPQGETIGTFSIVSGAIH